MGGPLTGKASWMSGSLTSTTCKKRHWKTAKGGLAQKPDSALCPSDAKRKKLCRTRLAILLNARYAQTSETMSFKSALPGEEFFDRELVGATSLLDRDPAAAHGRDHRGLATDAPPLDVRIWQLLDKPCRAYRLTGERFHQEPPSSSTGARLAPAGPACDQTGRKDSCMLAASLFHDPRSKRWDNSRLFHEFFTIVSVLSSTFSTFQIGGSDQHSAHTETEAPVPHHVFTLFSHPGASFFTFSS